MPPREQILTAPAPEAYLDAATAHALNARGELERVLFCWSRASTMGSQPSRRFLPLPPPRSMR
ncbi:hypothetical protein DO71_4599 [Burkholderia pseudomallei]|nr:hypothetical protein DO62_5648 [Burkholderia pseudomallei]KGC80129.1 hypothetical protein DO71_4599 [Burkholderia pseudomallei]